MAFKINWLRRILRVFWTAQKTSERVMEKAEVTIKLLITNAALSHQTEKVVVHWTHSIRSNSSVVGLNMTHKAWQTCKKWRPKRYWWNNVGLGQGLQLRHFEFSKTVLNRGGSSTVWKPLYGRPMVCFYSDSHFDTRYVTVAYRPTCSCKNSVMIWVCTAD